MKKISFLLVALLLLLAGCASKDEQTEQPVLWVVTEETPSDGMNYQVEMAAETFQQAHPEVTVKLEILPTDSLERGLYLKNLRTKIMSGNGPDVFLLPTGSILQINSRIRTQTNEITVEPLFHDVEQAMRSGIFLDLQSYYEADTDLDTAGLQQDVMAAGVIDGARYVLPLRYTMPVLLADLDNETVKSLPLESVFHSQGIASLATYALDTEDVQMAAGLLLPTDLSVFPALYDYVKGRTLVTEEEIAQYLRFYQRWRELTAEYQQQMIDTTAAGTTAYWNEVFHSFFPDIAEEFGMVFKIESFNNIINYIDYGDWHWTAWMPFYRTSLAGVLQNAILAEGMQLDVGVYPLRRTDGSVGAEVTYFGAVGAGCDDAEMAYEYLRLFLTEDYQWDAVRPRTDRSRDNMYYRAPELQHYGLVENSWPVRAVGAVSPLFDTMQYQMTAAFGGSGIPKNRVIEVKTGIQAGLSDASSMDFSILEVTIDEVRFPIYFPEEETLAYALSQLNEDDGTPTDADIDALAEQLWTYLWCHLAEG